MSSDAKDGKEVKSDGPPAEAKKRLNILGFQVSVAESKVKKVFFGATGFFVVFNGLALPFALPKLRRFLGAPYVPMKRTAVEVLFNQVLPTWALSRNGAAAVSKQGSSALSGLRLVDFGSGDGRVVAAAAQHGMHATGYELNPYLLAWSRIRCFRALRAGPGSGHLRWANAWSADLRNADVVTVYGRPGDSFMEHAARKLDEELPPHAAVVSHFFDMPGWEQRLVQDVEGLKLYDFSLRRDSEPRRTPVSSE
mmetsp:Transcript_51975/g.97239  ORF Transcript_51975/g.97239 Transcript_51975/m.97239 type:complete len:252 (+) Transcript_51975:59-814(+)